MAEAENLLNTEDLTDEDIREFSEDVEPIFRDKEVGPRHAAPLGLQVGSSWRLATRWLSTTRMNLNITIFVAKSPGICRRRRL